MRINSFFLTLSIYFCIKTHLQPRRAVLVPMKEIFKHLGKILNESEKWYFLVLLRLEYIRKVATLSPSSVLILLLTLLSQSGPKKVLLPHMSLMPTERDQVPCRSKVSFLVKGGELQAGALESTPSPWAGGGAAFRDLSVGKGRSSRSQRRRCPQHYRLSAGRSESAHSPLLLPP